MEAVASAPIDDFRDELSASAIDSNDFESYQRNIIHSWLRTITALTIVLVPLFFVLDIFVVPPELLPTFAAYRAASTVLAIIQHLIVRSTRPGRFSFLHGYFVSFHVGGVIALMTPALGGFESGYYAGLLMVIIGVNLLMPWKATHTVANSLLIIIIYVGLNFGLSSRIDSVAAANNLFFLTGVSVISVAINHVRFRLIQTEFSLLVQLKQARDSLWSEMELAKRVQVALLPRTLHVSGYEIAVSFSPAREVGGDYYDVIETSNGVRFVTIGDVAGHGLDSGLIMMMAQTAVMTVVKGDEDAEPTQVLESVNSVLRENVGRLGSNHYMTMTVLKLESERVTYAGHHQDILVHRHESGALDTIETTGSWLGIADSIRGYADSATFELGSNDSILLFSDGATEAMSESEEMYGQTRLTAAFQRYASRGPSEAVRLIQSEVQSHSSHQSDDMTIMVLQRRT